MKKSKLLITVFISFIFVFAVFSCRKPTEAEDPIPDSTVATPIFDPPPGSYSIAQNVTISRAILGATIHYTIDGTTPTESSTTYSSPLTISQDTTIKAKAFKSGWTPSSTATAVYTISATPPVQMIYVPGGTFHNGTSNVTVSSFYIGKYEITQAEYQAVIGSNPSYFGGNPDHPVEQVCWFNPIEYCNRRSIMDGLTPCYSYSTYGSNPDNWPSGWNSSPSHHTNVSCDWTANGYRLPTEMEWMYAAKGGSQSQDYTYSASNNIGDVAWYWGNSSSGTKPVGTKAPNELGIYDMSGNVLEWCWDIYGDYPSDDQTDPHGASGGNHVWRGGCWGNSADGCTVSIRGSSFASYSDQYLGFRLLRISH